MNKLKTKNMKYLFLNTLILTFGLYCVAQTASAQTSIQPLPVPATQLLPGQAPQPLPGQAPLPVTHQNCSSPMSDDNYKSLKNDVVNCTTDNLKLSKSIADIGATCMSTEQVRGIMNLFELEQTKLDFAKFAYIHTCDQGNYSKLSDAFSASSAMELNSYVKAQN